MTQDSGDKLCAFGSDKAEGIRVASPSAEHRSEMVLSEQTDLLNLIYDSIFVCDTKGTIRYWNRAAEELYGWSAQQAVGKVVYELLKTVFPSSREEAEADVLRAGRWEGEVVHTKKDGGQVIVASRWSLQRDESGAPIAVLVANHDVSERKRAEQARDQLEEQWRAAFECNPTMYFIVDAAGAIASVNPFGAEQLGYRVGELVGQPALSVFYEPDRGFVQSRAEACFAEPGRTMQWEARKIRKDGTMLWVRETGRAVVLKREPVLLVVCEDITEQKRAQEAERRSEKELRDVIETIPAMAWTNLPDGSCTFVNRRWIQYTGQALEDVAGWRWQAALHPDDLAGHVEKWRASLASGQAFENEARFRRAADGEYRWFLVRGVPLRDEERHVHKWYGILTDIDDRKRTEALLAGERRILEMVAKSDSLPGILDSLCRLVEEHAPDVLASILLIEDGRLKHGGAPSLPRAFVAGIDGAAIGPAVGSCGTAAFFAKQVVVSDIATDPLWDCYREPALSHGLRACWSTPIMSSEGKVIATFAMYYREPRSPSRLDQEVIEQITHLAGVAIQRKLTEEKLQRSEAYLEEAQRLSKTGSWAWSPATEKVIYWSPEMFRIFGIDPQAGLPTQQTLWHRVHPEDRDRADRDVRSAVARKADYIVEYRIVLPDATLRYVQVIGHPVLDQAGDVIECVGTAIDVTERKHAEEEHERLRQLEADLAHINRVTTMGELTASLAHELNQPMAAAIANASACLRWLARDKPELGEAREVAKRIVADATRAAEIINRLRSFYKKGTVPQREPIDVNELAREMLVLLRNEANRYAIAMRTELAELPLVMADRVQVQQVLMNLMLNGIEAMKETGGELTVKSQLTERGELLISVSDTGVGLPRGKESELFNAFFTTKPQGTGMGLAISRSIIESHDGRLWACTNAERGSTFIFTLPRGAITDT